MLLNRFSKFLKDVLDLFDNLNFLFPQGVKTPCFRIFVLLNFRSFRTSLLKIKDRKNKN